MNKVIWNTLTAMCVAGLISSARAQDTAPASPPDNQNPPVGADAAAAGDQAAAPDVNAMAPADAGTAAADATAAATATGDDTAPPDRPARVRPAEPEDRPAANLSLTARSAETFMSPNIVGTNADELVLNFNKAPLVEVLNYLSDAAGFYIVLQTQVRGTVSVISKHPMTRDQAVDLLNSLLNKSGVAAIRHGRELDIVDKTEAKTGDIPVKTAYEVSDIPDNAEIATWIIPVRFVEATQLTRDLASFVASDATIVANEAGNSIVLTDTQSNTRHLLEIIKAVDNGAEGETTIKVYHMTNANPTEVANEITSIFPSSSGGGSAQPIRFAGGGAGGRGGGGAGGPGAFMAAMLGGGAGGGNNSRIQKQTQVLAVPDARTSSVIVTASKDMIAEITETIAELDVPSLRDNTVHVHQMKNGDVIADLTVLQTMFGGNNSRNTTTTTSALTQRQTSNASQGGTGSSSSSSGIGGGSSMGGGGGGRSSGGF